ncbi:hypothetical protein N8A90_15790, partial [Variovorax sp. N23]|nr:hypothetical protein [Variovorax sp. N23]
MRAFNGKLNSIVQPMRQNMTYDHGPDGMHAKLIEQTGVAVYFCHPQSPRHRGSNENTMSWYGNQPNRLLKYSPCGRARSFAEGCFSHGELR